MSHHRTTALALVLVLPYLASTTVVAAFSLTTAQRRMPTPNHPQSTAARYASSSDNSQKQEQSDSIDDYNPLFDGNAGVVNVGDNDDDEIQDEVDVAIVGAGIGGLVAGAILNTLYGKRVAVFESHYLPGGCAHAFDRKAANGETFTFDSGPTILLG